MEKENLCDCEKLELRRKKPFYIGLVLHQQGIKQKVTKIKTISPTASKPLSPF